LILLLHRKDHSPFIQQVLSAGPLESLLAGHGEAFIDRIELEAHADPSFAELLGGVWQSRMSDAVWGTRPRGLGSQRLGVTSLRRLWTFRRSPSSASRPGRHNPVYTRIGYQLPHVLVGVNNDSEVHAIDRSVPAIHLNRALEIGGF
jgi:hypothetical protein